MSVRASPVPSVVRGSWVLKFFSSSLGGRAAGPSARSGPRTAPVVTSQRCAATASRREGLASSWLHTPSSCQPKHQVAAVLGADAELLLHRRRTRRRVCGRRAEAAVAAGTDVAARERCRPCRPCRPPRPAARKSLQKTSPRCAGRGATTSTTSWRSAREYQRRPHQSTPPLKEGASSAPQMYQSGLPRERERERERGKESDRDHQNVCVCRRIQFCICRHRAAKPLQFCQIPVSERSSVGPGV